MTEMEISGNENSDAPLKRTESQVSILGQDPEDEKERTIAKAALSIAELGALGGFFCLVSRSNYLVALLDGPAPPSSDDDTPRNGHADLEGMSNPEESGARIPLRSINAVAAHVPFIEDARTKVTSEMENMVLTGLTTLVSSCVFLPIECSLTVTRINHYLHHPFKRRLISEFSRNWSNLSFLTYLKLWRIASGARLISPKYPEMRRPKVGLFLSVYSALLRHISLLTCSWTDPAPNSPQSPTSYKSRVRTEPTTYTAPQWTAALWARLENMVEEMADCCVKVCLYFLEAGRATVAGNHSERPIVSGYLPECLVLWRSLY